MPQVAAFIFLRFSPPSMLRCCWDSAVAVVTTSRAEQPTIRGSIPDTEIFLSSGPSRQTMGPTQSPILYRLGGGKRSEREPDHLPPPSWGYEWVEPYLYPHICLHGVDRDNSNFIINKSTRHHALNCKPTTTFFFFKTYKRFEGRHKPTDKYHLSIVRLVQAPVMINIHDVFVNYRRPHCALL